MSNEPCHILSQHFHLHAQKHFVISGARGHAHLKHVNAEQVLTSSNTAEFSHNSIRLHPGSGEHIGTKETTSNIKNDVTLSATQSNIDTAPDSVGENVTTVTQERSNISSVKPPEEREIHSDERRIIDSIGELKNPSRIMPTPMEIMLSSDRTFATEAETAEVNKTSTNMMSGKDILQRALSNTIPEPSEDVRASEARSNSPAGDSVNHSERVNTAEDHKLHTSEHQQFKHSLPGSHTITAHAKQILGQNTSFWKTVKKGSFFLFQTTTLRSSVSENVNRCMHKMYALMKCSIYR